MIDLHFNFAFQLDLIQQTVRRWVISNLKPLSGDYIFTGLQGNREVVLKASPDIQALNQEARALKAFAGFGVVEVLAQEGGVLLLERVMPGGSLKSYFPVKDQEAVQIACEVIRKLHHAPLPARDEFPHIKNWLLLLDRVWNIPESYINKARALRDKLLATSAPEVLLHGDLHHENILSRGSDFAVIDPKGVIGERAYEVGAFIRNPIPQLLDDPDADNIIKTRIRDFASNLDLDANRIADWCFVQAVLAWAWALEDGLNTVYYKPLAELLYNLVL